MKKRWVMIIAVVVAVMLIAGTAVSAEKVQNRHQSGVAISVSCDNYTDADNDGVCDNAAKDREQCGYTDADNDGTCDNAAKDREQCGYTDADNDGVCDNAAKDRKQCGNGNGQRNGAKRQCGVNKR